MNTLNLKNIFLLSFICLGLISSKPKRHIPIYANIATFDRDKLQNINSNFYKEKLQYNLFFLETEEKDCKILKKINHHKQHDYLIIYKEHIMNDALILFQLDKKTNNITNHKILSEIYSSDGFSCIKKSILYDDFFEINTICINDHTKKMDTIFHKYNYQFKLMK